MRSEKGLFFGILLCLANFGVLFGQDEVITGKIVDSQSEFPVPFATIKIKSKMLGVVSNANGDFQIPMRFRQESDSLVISCIGYSSRTISFQDLKQSEFNLITLSPSIGSLNEVVVKPKRNRNLSASKILKQAITNIKVNYPQEPYSYIGYYRDYQMIDTSYLNLNEAIIEVYDQGFYSFDFAKTLIELYQFKRNTDFPLDTTTTKPYDNKPAKYGRGENKYIPNGKLSPLGGNELSILRLHDAIRNYSWYSFSFVDVFARDFENNHFLKLEEDVNLDTLSLYTISFRSKFDASGPINYSVGKLFIEKSNFAIHKMEYSTYNKTMKGDQLMYAIQTEYARVGDKMMLNYISFNNGFKTHNDTDFKVIKTSYNQDEQALVIELNSIPEPTSVTNVNNYELKFGNQKLVIQSALLKGELQVSLALDQKSADLISANRGDISSKLTLSASGIRDLKNRELDKSSSTTVFQFRELFVQKLFPSKSAPNDRRYMDKNAPLSQEMVGLNLQDMGDYWMNTPLRSTSNQ